MKGAELLRAGELRKWSKELCSQRSLDGRNDMDRKDNRKCVPIQKFKLKLNRSDPNIGKVKRRGDHRSTALFWQKGTPLQ